jgi:hypothetical protein
MIDKNNMLKKLKGLFIVEENGASPDSGIKVESKEPVHIPNEAVRESVQPSFSKPIVGDVVPDQKFTDLLLKAIETQNLDGFDYLEFKNSVQSLTKVIPDESMRFKSAFEMAKTMGLDKAKLIQSGTHYINVLNAENKKFKDALENQKAKQIQGKSDQVAAVEKSISDKNKMIETLKKEIESHTAQLDQLRNEVNEAVVKIETTNQQFVASFNLVYHQINDDIEKIKSHV